MNKYDPSTNRTSNEQQIINAKYAAPRFALMDLVTLTKTTKVLLLKINVITGWPIPEKELKDILVDQLVKKIQENYGEVNTEEVEYAFRTTRVKEWGKNMNLNLFDEVMQEYLAQRREISTKEEYQKMNALPVSPRWPQWEIDRDYAFYLASRIDRRLKPPLQKILSSEK